MKKLIPLGDRVLVKREAAQAVSKGGIHIPDSVQKKSAEAVVVAVGPGARAEDGHRIELSVKTGDLVLLAEWSGAEVEHNGEKMLVVREDDILAIVG